MRSKPILPTTLVLSAIALGLSAPAHADSFTPPSVREVHSTSGEVVVTIIPAMLSCAVGEADCEPAARAIVEHVNGAYRGPSRTVRLRNEQAPGQVLVTDDGLRLLTINDYASAGFGDNVLVVYDERGQVIAHHALSDFLPPDYIAGLPRTASSLRWWAQDARIEPGTHRAVISLIEVERASDVPRPAVQSGFDLVLDLDTGAIERPAGPRWDNALACARANSWLVPDRAAERRREAYRQQCR